MRVGKRVERGDTHIDCLHPVVRTNPVVFVYVCVCAHVVSHHCVQGASGPIGPALLLPHGGLGHCPHPVLSQQQQPGTLSALPLPPPLLPSLLYGRELS